MSNEIYLQCGNSECLSVATEKGLLRNLRRVFIFSIVSEEGVVLDFPALAKQKSYVGFFFFSKAFYLCTKSHVFGGLETISSPLPKALLNIS